MAQGKGNKAKQRRHGRDAAYYAKQFFVTDNNKLRRDIKRQRIAKSEKTLRRKAMREERHEVKRQANLIRNAKRNKAQPISAFTTPTNPATQTL